MIRLTLVCLFFSILEHGGNNLRQVDELMICGICIVFGKKVKVLLLSSTRQAAIVTACPYCNYQEKFAYCSFCMNVHRSNNLYKRLTFLLFDDIFIIERLIMLQTDSASSCKYSTTFFCFFRRRDSLSQLRVERRWFELASKGDLVDTHN